MSSTSPTSPTSPSYSASNASAPKKSTCLGVIKGFFGRHTVKTAPNLTEESRKSTTNRYFLYKGTNEAVEVTIGSNDHTLSDHNPSIESVKTSSIATSLWLALRGAKSFLSTTWKDAMFTPKFTEALEYKAPGRGDSAADDQSSAIGHVRLEYYSSNELNANRLKKRVAGCVRRGRDKDFKEIKSMINAYGGSDGHGFGDLLEETKALAAIKEALKAAQDDSSITEPKKSKVQECFEMF